MNDEKVWHAWARYAALLFLAALPFIVTKALAGNDVLVNFYGNTLISMDGGIKSYFWYKPDHTFTGSVPAYYLALKGTWSQSADGTICRVFDPPLPTMDNPDCGPMLVHNVGDVESDANGHREKLVAGVQTVRASQSEQQISQSMSAQ